MRFVEYHPKAPGDANRLLNHYDLISPELGNAFWSELLEAIERARLNPEVHHFDATGLRRANFRGKKKITPTSQPVPLQPALRADLRVYLHVRKKDEKYNTTSYIHFRIRCFSKSR